LSEFSKSLSFSIFFQVHKNQVFDNPSICSQSIRCGRNDDWTTIMKLIHHFRICAKCLTQFTLSYM